jgi:hypothetical protein
MLALVLADTAVNPITGIWGDIKEIMANPNLNDTEKANAIIDARARRYSTQAAPQWRNGLINRLKALRAFSSSVAADGGAAPANPPHPGAQTGNRSLPPSVSGKIRAQVFRTFPGETAARWGTFWEGSGESLGLPGALVTVLGVRPVLLSLETGAEADRSLPYNQSSPEPSHN